MANQNQNNNQKTELNRQNEQDMEGATQRAELEEEDGGQAAQM